MMLLIVFFFKQLVPNSSNLDACIPWPQQVARSINMLLLYMPPCHWSTCLSGLIWKGEAYLFLCFRSFSLVLQKNKHITQWNGPYGRLCAVIVCTKIWEAVYSCW
jgi:hypothetical protein